MAKKTSIDKLSDDIQKILSEYGDDVAENVTEAVEKVTKAGVRAIKSEAKSSFRGTGKYASGWKSKVEKDRLGAEGVIYNASLPGLPHLLENGHAKRGGGRVPGKVHIKPVEDMITKELESAVEGAL